MWSWYSKGRSFWLVMTVQIRNEHQMSVTFSSENAGFSVTFLICISWNPKCDVSVFLQGQLCWEYGKEVHYFTRGARQVCHRLLHEEQSSVGFRNSQERNRSCHCLKKRYCGRVWWNGLFLLWKLWQGLRSVRVMLCRHTYLRSVHAHTCLWDMILWFYDLYLRCKEFTAMQTFANGSQLSVSAYLFLFL